MYSLEEFDKAKTKILRYILYKKRTENEVRTKFKNDIDEEMLEDAIEYLKEAKYIDDEDYIEKTINNFKILKKMSIMELKYKLQAKGLNKDLIEDYIYQNRDELIEYEINSAEKIILRKDQEKPEIVSYLMKKILFSAYSLDVGGIETALITLLKNIKNDYEITLCLEKKEGIFLNELPQNVKIITYKPSNFKIMPIRKILNFIKQQIFKIKYKNKFYFSACYATYSYSASFVARTASKNNALWVHNDYMSFYENDKKIYKG